MGSRGRAVALVFSMQGVGSLVASLVALILLSIFDFDHISYVWRLCLGLGAIPGLLSLYFRVTMEETSQFAKRKKINYKDAMSRYWRDMLGLIFGDFI
jgi:MFS family permease